MTKKTVEVIDETETWKDKVGMFVIGVCLVVGASWLMFHIMFTAIPATYNHFTGSNSHLEMYNDRCELELGTYVPCSTGWITITSEW